MPAPIIKREASNDAFLRIVTDLRVTEPAGFFLPAADKAVSALLAKINETGKGGSVTLTVEVSPHGLGAGDVPMFVVTGSISTKLPKKKKSGQTFFLDDAGLLTREGPGQRELSISEAPREAAPAIVQRDVVIQPAR